MRQLAVAVHSNETPRLREKVESFLTALSGICQDVVVLVGGYWGHMKDVVDNALRLGLKTVVFLPIERENVELPRDVVFIKTGCEFRCRSVLMIRSADAVVVLGGGVGTIIEAFMAYAMGKPLFILTDTDTYSDRLRDAYPDYFDERKAVRVVYSKDPVELARLVCQVQGGVLTNFG
ncbi:MAG: LOG family protein [Pyrobaculum sp.]